MSPLSQAAPTASAWQRRIFARPGNPAYNVSKAGVKAVTEALQQDLRSTAGCQLSAHLLVPGFTYPGMIKAFIPDKPDGAGLDSGAGHRLYG